MNHRWRDFHKASIGVERLLDHAKRQLPVGRERGYPVGVVGYRIGATLGGEAATRLTCSYSDDLGRSWHEAKLKDTGPLATAVVPGRNFVEEPDGTIAAPVYGYQTGDDLSVRLYTCALVRSHDGGESWGDWSIIAYDEERRFNFSETALVAIPDGTWVAFLRSEGIYGVPYELLIKRTVSTDRGRHWSHPEPCAARRVPLYMISCAHTPRSAPAETQNALPGSVGLLGSQAT